MQDRYAGDIGDYVKLALLRAIAPTISSESCGICILTKPTTETDDILLIWIRPVVGAILTQHCSTLCSRYYRCGL